MTEPAEVLRDPRGRISPALARVARALSPVVRALHRPTLEGLEHLPRSGAFLLVANHSAALGLSEIACFLCCYLDQVGTARPIAGFAHPLGITLPPSSMFLRHVGAIPSTYEAAESALSAGVPILVFPGGDHETMRPLWQAHAVDLGGRRGFLKIARKLGVPIVPMGIRGSHLTVPILARSRVLPWLLVWPRLLGLKRWPLTLLGVLGVAALLAFAPWSLPLRALAAWLWLASPLPLTPIVPATIRMRLGAPIPSEVLFAPDDVTLARALTVVQDRLQRLVDGLSRR